MSLISEHEIDDAEVQKQKSKGEEMLREREKRDNKFQSL